MTNDQASTLASRSASRHTARVLLAVDARYDDARAEALAAGVLFADWSSNDALTTWRICTHGHAAYRPGHFFERELPALVPVVRAALAAGVLHTVIVDGYVDLGDQRPGLGRHLFEAFERAFTVVGVAKNPFRGAPAIPVLRGESKRPMWVTSSHDPSRAASLVQHMAGDHRIPQLLQQVDSLTRRPS